MRQLATLAIPAFALVTATTAAARMPFPVQPGELDPNRTISRRAAAKPAAVEAGSESGLEVWIESDRATADWLGLRPQLEQLGVNLEASWIVDSTRGFGHSPVKRWATRSLADVNLGLDLEKGIGWSGATIFADAYGLWGHEAGVDLGDYQSTDAIDAGDDFFQLGELWLQQELFDGRLRLKLGKIDANSEFGFTDIAGEFMHASAAWSPTFALMPTYPDPSTAALLFVYPTRHLYAGIGLFDGSGDDGVRTGLRGPETFFHGSDDHYLISEMGVMWDEACAGMGAGRLAFGPWLHTSKFDRLDGGPDRVNGSMGFWVNLEQQLWRENPGSDDDEQGLAVYLRYGYADDDVFEVGDSVGAGLVWRGAIPTRDADSVGIMTSWIELTDATGYGFDGNETAYELYYRFQLTGFLSLLTDFQWIAQPSGVKGDTDLFVAGTRLELTF